MEKNPSRPLLEYGMAILVVTIAVLSRWLLNPLLDHRLPFATMYPAIAVTVWFGGGRPAFLAAVLGFIAVNRLIIETEPATPLSLQGVGGIAGLVVYLASSAIVIFFGCAMRAAQERAEKSQQALKKADRKKDDFLATLAHELRNPLAPIRNALEILKRATDDRSQAEQARRIMERQVQQMVRLIDDLLDISRITRGKLQLRKERMALADAVANAVEEARPLIEAAAHELTVTLPEAPIYLDADPTRLAQVVSNLLFNAAKYTTKGGHIWLIVERTGGEAVLSVRDTGIGIAAEHLPHIFKMFSQATPVLERSQGGLGVGLALVQGIVELHGGTIEARSSGIGMGSEFIVRLPTGDTPAEKVLQERESGERFRAGPKCRILVVDDNQDAAASLATLLRLKGHEIQKAHDGVEAIQTAATFRPNVVLLDIGLPKMNGYEVAAQLRQHPRDGKVTLVALTGWGRGEDKRRALEAGFDHHLTKPVEPADLDKLLALIPPPEAQSELNHQRPRRFLLVDDQQDVAEGLARLLRFDGHETRVATGGLEALDLAAVYQPQVVLLDINLPGMNGYEVARRIREQPWGRNTVVIALSGLGEEEDVRQSKEAGFDHHLVKPIKSETLYELLHQRRDSGRP